MARVSVSAPFQPNHRLSLVICIFKHNNTLLNVNICGVRDTDGRMNKPLSLGRAQEMDEGTLRRSAEAYARRPPSDRQRLDDNSAMHPSAASRPSASSALLPALTSHRRTGSEELSRSTAKDLQMPLSPSKTSPIKANRFSLTFPVHTILNGTSASHSNQSALASPSFDTPSKDGLPRASDSDFLTALAAQERRVLELKEELSRADEDLARLKSQWAMREATAKRNEARHVHQMRQLSTPMAGGREDKDDMGGSSYWMHMEMQKRKALMTGNRSPKRKVIPGSRHTRTLSLLSPEKQLDSSYFPPQGDRRESQSPSRQPLPLRRSSTTPDFPQQIELNVEDGTLDEIGPTQCTNSHDQRELLLHTRKQMASDLKDGLWTFFEDLRQATVGAEGVSGTRSRTTQTPGLRTARRHSRGPAVTGSRRSESPLRAQPSNRASPTRSSSTVNDISSASWGEHNSSEPLPPRAPSLIKRRPYTTTRNPLHDKPDLRPTSSHSLDGLENWNDNTPSKVMRRPDESRPGSSSNSSISDVGRHSHASASIAASSPGTSPVPTIDAQGVTAIAGKRASSDLPIPWPALDGSGSGRLAKSAGSLVEQWEDSRSKEITRG